MPISAKDNLSPSMELSHRVEEDISARQLWADDWDTLEEIRLGRRKSNPIYPNAPNWVDPIVDVNVSRVTEIEHTSLFTPRYLAHFIPLSKEGAQFKRDLEIGFDHLLKMTLEVGTTINTLLDTKNQGGMAVGKQVMDFDSYNRVFNQDVAIPTIAYMHPLNVIIPPETQQMQKSIRITDVHQFPVNRFRQTARNRNWKNAEKLITALGITKNNENTGNSTVLPHAYRSKLILEEETNHIVTVAVYETYYLDEKGNNKVVIYCPDHPDITLAEFDHKWATGPRAGQNKRWKHDQFRYEDRNPFYQDVRGITHLLKDNQQAASQYLNIKGTHYDLSAWPMVRSPSGSSTINKFRPGPGKDMGDLEFVQIPGIDPTFNLDADVERARAAQRVGSTLGSESSVNRSRDRKTAEEVKTERNNSLLMSAGSSMRFTRPLSSLFSNMWEEIQANPISLPIISASTGENTGTIPPEAFELPFLVISSANSKTADPDFINAQLGPVLQILQNYPQVEPLPILRKYLDNIDPDMADEATASQTNGPLAQNIQQLNEQVQALSRENEQMAERIAALMELAEVNIQTDKEQDEEIKKIAEAKKEVTEMIKKEIEKFHPPKSASKN